MVDTDSELAFPSLAPLAAPAIRPVASWGNNAGPRIQPAAQKQNVVTDSFTLTAIDLSTAARDGKTPTLGEIMKQVMAKYKVKVEASSNQKNRQTTFHLRSESSKELDRAKRSLIALLSPVVRVYDFSPCRFI